MGDLSKHFSRKEFACPCGCGGDVVDAELIAVLEIVREIFNSPISITSGYRCAEHNAKIGGAANSMHLTGKAADFAVIRGHPDKVASYLDGVFPGRYGIGRYRTWTHLDVRATGARWDKR